MYAVIAEHKSDVDTLKSFIEKLANEKGLTIKGFGFNGSGELLKKGAKQLQLFADLQFEKFVVCYDSDGNDPDQRKNEIIQEVIIPSGIAKKGAICVLVPVQEIEAWILADIQAVTNIMPGWRPAEVHNPESIPNPKEYLEKLSRGSNKKPRYSHAIHNKAVAKHLDLTLVKKKCPSFHPLCTLVETGKGNYPVNPI